MSPGSKEPRIICINQYRMQWEQKEMSVGLIHKEKHSQGTCRLQKLFHLRTDGSQYLKVICFKLYISWVIYILNAFIFLQKAMKGRKYIVSTCLFLRLYGILNKFLPELNSWFMHSRDFVTFFFLIFPEKSGWRC